MNIHTVSRKKEKKENIHKLQLILMKGFPHKINISVYLTKAYQRKYRYLSKRKVENKTTHFLYDSEKSVCPPLDC